MCACMRATCVHAILGTAYLLEVLVEVWAPQDVHAQLDEQHNLHKSEYPRAIGFLFFGHRRMRGADVATASPGSGPVQMWQGASGRTCAKKHWICAGMANAEMTPNVPAADETSE